MAQRVPSATATLSDDCWVTWLFVAPVLRWEIYGNLTHRLFWHQKDEDLVELWVLGASSQEKTETIPSSKPCLHMFTPTHPEALPSAISICLFSLFCLFSLVSYQQCQQGDPLSWRCLPKSRFSFLAAWQKFADVKPHRLQVDVYQIPRFERNQRS